MGMSPTAALVSLSRTWHLWPSENARFSRKNNCATALCSGEGNDAIDERAWFNLVGKIWMFEEIELLNRYLA
jgi:hypothetical protein